MKKDIKSCDETCACGCQEGNEGTCEAETKCTCGCEEGNCTWDETCICGCQNKESKCECSK